MLTGRQLRGALLGCLLMLFTALSPLVAAGAETYPPGPEVVLGTLSEQTVRDGAIVIITGNGFVAGARLRVSVDGAPNATVIADAMGAFSTPVRMRGVGTHAIAVSGPSPTGRERVVSDPVTVVAALPVQKKSVPLVSRPTLRALLFGFLVVVLTVGLWLGRRARVERRASQR